MTEHDKEDGRDPAPAEPAPETEYQPPELRKYGSLAELTRSGTGTAMESGKGPPRDFA